MNPTTNPGMSPAVTEALQRRSGSSTPQLSQTSPDARMQSQVPQPMPQGEMTSTSNPPAQTGAPAPSQKYEPQNQEDLVVMALIEH